MIVLRYGSMPTEMRTGPGRRFLLEVRDERERTGGDRNAIAHGFLPGVRNRPSGSVGKGAVRVNRSAPQDRPNDPAADRQALVGAEAMAVLKVVELDCPSEGEIHEREIGIVPGGECALPRKCKALGGARRGHGRDSLERKPAIGVASGE